MKGYVVSTVIVIIGGIMMILLQIQGVSKPWSVGIGIAISTIGFALQIFFAFNTRRKFERGLKARNEKHRKFMSEVSALPPEQAIKHLLGKSS